MRAQFSPSVRRPRRSDHRTSRKHLWDRRAIRSRLSRFEELSRRKAADTAILYAFDLIEHDGEDMRNLPFLDRKAALALLLRNSGAGILFNEHIAEDGAVVFAHACRLGAEGIVLKKVDSTYRSGPCRLWIKVRNPASIAVQRERIEDLE
jgi:bifunctional non-homologous end joining protein LigD